MIIIECHNKYFDWWSRNFFNALVKIQFSSFISLDRCLCVKISEPQTESEYVDSLKYFPDKIDRLAEIIDRVRHFLQFIVIFVLFSFLFSVISMKLIIIEKIRVIPQILNMISYSIRMLFVNEIFNKYLFLTYSRKDKEKFKKIRKSGQILSNNCFDHDCKRRTTNWILILFICHTCPTWKLNSSIQLFKLWVEVSR